MTTTLVRDSIVGDDWLRQVAAAVPVQRIMDKTTGNFNGVFLTGPVRLSWVDLFELPAKKPGATSEPKYGANLLFTPLLDPTILYEEYYRICGQSFAQYFDAASQQYHGLQSPFSDQSGKLRYKGYTPGCITINARSKFKPSVVDINNNPIVDAKRVYPGVWAICAINAYAYGINPPQPKKGVNYGLQSVMILGDDTNIGAGGPDTAHQFAGAIGKAAAPIVRPDMAQQFGQAMPPSHAPAPAIPGYTAPGGGVPRPGQGQPPVIPQTHYSPPVGLPGQPVPPVQPVPPAAVPHAAPATWTPPEENYDDMYS